MRSLLFFEGLCDRMMMCPKCVEGCDDRGWTAGKGGYDCAVVGSGIEIQQ